ncbi:hypothetical protein [Oligoflexus tunisiensis]|uniref:hypothetical protein n=1 Tax=Oligoflexus tunisiensis TaxID=708132 RepID=UPI00114CE64F|nr:hypothetical protein [Oligoflexus tunisiensis]
MILLTITNSEVWAWDTSVSADLSVPFVQGDPVMSFAGTGTYKFTEKYSLSLSQGVEKNLFVDSEVREFELADSVISFNVYPRTLIPKIGWTVRLLATLPVSHNSQVNEVFSKPEARWTAAYPVIETFNLALSAFIRYTWSRYDTTKPQDLSGGLPLPEFSGGFGHSGNWTFLPEWTLSYGASYSEIKYHTVTYEGPGDPPIFDQPDQAYSLSVSVNWTVTPLDSVSMVYSYGGILLQPGLDDYVLFDEEESRWAIGYVRSFE